ncbi:peptide ABC transporter substrate-binding protein [Lachnospiraceae bacterium 48-21]|nr:peptide ABC transporter substrate-binding protein [Dorea sp.]
MKKKLVAVLLTASMALSLAACGGKGDGGSSGGSQGGSGSGEAQEFNTFLATEPSTLDTIKGNDMYGWDINKNTLEPLTRLVEKDGEQEREGAGAESWEPNEDGTVWTFKIRDNKWSDGEDVTAADYAYGITRTLDPEAGSPNSFFTAPFIKNGQKVVNGELGVEELGVKAVDDKTLEITLEAPTPYFMSITDTRACYPVRQDIAEKYGETYGSELDSLVFNGPFKVDSWTHNSEITLVKNDQYWDKDNVKLDKVKFSIITDSNARYNSFESGALDNISVGEQEWVDRFSAKENVERVDTKQPAMRFDFFNVEDELFGNLNIRKAFALAVDREDMAKTIYQDLHVPAYWWVPEGISTGENGEYREQVEGPLAKIAKEEDAKELLLKGMEELGLGSDPSKITVKYSLSATTQWARNYGEYVQQKYKDILGVNIELDFNEWSTFQQKTNSGDFQMANMVWTTDYDDPMSMISLFTTENSGNIPTNWSNATFDDLIAQASREMDESKRVDLYAQAETVLFEEGCNICPLVNERKIAFHYDYAKNLNERETTTTGFKYVYIEGK